MRFRLPVLAAMSVFAVAATAHAGKGPSKAVVDQVAQFAVQADAVYQPPVGEPSPAAGSFVQAYAAPDGEEPNPARVGTYDVSTSSCSKHLTFKTVDAVEKREALVVMKTGVAASLGLPIPALSFSGGHSALAGIKYQLDEKLILDGGQEEMTKCCVENPSQCTDEIISEWWKGAGKVHRVDTSAAGLKVLSKLLSAAGGAVDLSTSKGFSVSSEWDQPMYFAYRTQRLKLSSCAEYLNNNPLGADQATFTGVSKFLDSEQEARRDARDDAQRQLVEALGQRYSIADGEITKAADALLSGVLESFICVDVQDGPRPQFQARARLNVESTRFEAALAELKTDAE